jgi:hypothetical protein
VQAEKSEADRLALEQLETQLWQAETRFDMNFMKQVLAEDFFEFGMSGRIYRRHEILEIPYQPIEAVMPLPGFRVCMLSNDTAHVTYRSIVKQADGWTHANRSSIWSRSKTGWLLRFHQGTQTAPA